MSDGDFDRLRIPLEPGSAGGRPSEPGLAENGAEPIAETDPRLGIAATPGQLAAGSAVVAGLVLVGVAAVRRRRNGHP